MSESRGISPVILTLALLGVCFALAYGAYLTTRPAPPEEIQGGDVQIVSKGAAFDYKKHLAAGKYTIFDYYADWCPPCRVLDPQLRRLAADRPDVALRKVDIVDWTTDVVRQHSITDLPHLEIYDPDGKLIATGEDAFGTLEKIFHIEVF